MILFSYTDNQGILLGDGEPWGSSFRGPGFPVGMSFPLILSIDTGHIARSPQSGPRWSPAFKMEPVLSVSSFKISRAGSLSLRQCDSFISRGM